MWYNVKGIKAFANAGKQWTEELCRADSDGDIKTNGEELGDPDCKWKPGDPAPSAPVGHPGICEPVGSSLCQAAGSTFKCDNVEPYDCPATREPGVGSSDLNFPKTRVPTEYTSYYCQIFQIPLDKTRHIIGVEPIIDTPEIVHHMLLLGCPSQTKPKAPYRCNMLPNECRDILHTWTIGMDGYCLNDEVGLAMGKNHYEYLGVQVHWTNPRNLDTYMDASGIKIFYTENLRPNIEQVGIFGQVDINIPARTQLTSIEGTCPARCTEMFGKPMYISSALLHMHYLGISGVTEQYRDGKLLRVIASADYYDYNTPPLFLFKPAIDFLPGDEIRTVCNFNSLNGTRRRDSTTKFGEGTFDEMCFTFINYYDASYNMRTFHCFNIGSRNPCTLSYSGNQGCDTCELHKALISLNDYIMESGVCLNECDGSCKSLFQAWYDSPCGQNALASASLESNSPLAAGAVAKATTGYWRCFGSPVASGSDTPSIDECLGRQSSATKITGSLLVLLIAQMFYVRI